MIEEPHVAEAGQSQIAMGGYPYGQDLASVTDVVMDSGSGLPIFVGTLPEAPTRWAQVMEWLPPLVRQVGGKLYRVNCTRETDGAKGCADCHVLVARAALKHFNGQPGVYLDLEDNVKPSLRFDAALVAQAATRLAAQPEWRFISASRFPIPYGLIDPHTCADTPLYEYGGNVYRKLFGANELTQAVVMHTAFATRIADAHSGLFVGEPYDESLKRFMLYVIYPSPFQRHTASETKTMVGDFNTPIGVWLRDVFFTPWLYTFIDFLDVRGGWLVFLGVPIIVIMCIVPQPVPLFCFVAGFIICWALGFR